MLSAALCTPSNQPGPSTVALARHSAILELGSVFRLIVADPWTRRVTSRVEASVDFGAQYHRLGVIEDVSWANALRVAGALAARGRALATAGLTVVATGPARDALNGASFVEAMRSMHGLPVQILDAEREAALVYRAAMREGVSGRGLLVIPGWSSVEVVFGRGPTPERNVSLPLGAGTLLEELGGPRSGAVCREAQREIEARVRAALAPFLSRGLLAGPCPLVLAGRQVAALAPLLGDNTRRVTLAESRALAMALQGLPVADVGRLSGAFPTASWAAALVASILTVLGVGVARVSTAAACEGLVAERPGAA